MVKDASAAGLSVTPELYWFPGVLLSREVLERAAQLTARAGAWLIMDNTYEHFVYEGLQHHCVSAPHIIHLFSFSKVDSTLKSMTCVVTFLHAL